jgi:antitoxin ParD1/3/4
MGKNTSVSLGLHYEALIDDCVTKGRYQNTSEVIRAGLRLLEEEENRFMLLGQAIHEGVNSGIAINFDSKKHLEALKTKRKING